MTRNGSLILPILLLWGLAAAQTTNTTAKKPVVKTPPNVNSAPTAALPGEIPRTPPTNPPQHPFVPPAPNPALYNMSTSGTVVTSCGVTRVVVPFNNYHGSAVLSWNPYQSFTFSGQFVPALLNTQVTAAMQLYWGNGDLIKTFTYSAPDLGGVHWQQTIADHEPPRNHVQAQCPLGQQPIHWKMQLTISPVK